MIRQVPGAADTAVEQEADQAQLRIAIDPPEVARYGDQRARRPGHDRTGHRRACGQHPVRRRAAFSTITVRFEPEARVRRARPSARFWFRRAKAAACRWRSWPTSIVDGASIIARRENRRQISVRTNIRGRDQGSFVADAQKRFDAQVKLPPGYRVEWGGQFENLERARRRLTVILPVTIAIIFALLFFTFGSAVIRRAGADERAVLAGRRDRGALLARHQPERLGGGGLHLAVRCRGDERRAGEWPRSIAAGWSPACPWSPPSFQGALAQMRPVLMMILVAMLGMVPAARATGIGSDVQRPLATVVVGGLLSTLLLTLLVLPALYALAVRQEPEEGPPEERQVAE